MRPVRRLLCKGGRCPKQNASPTWATTATIPVRLSASVTCLVSGSIARSRPAPGSCRSIPLPQQCHGVYGRHRGQQRPTCCRDEAVDLATACSRHGRRPRGRRLRDCNLAAPCAGVRPGPGQPARDGGRSLPGQRRPKRPLDRRWLLSSAEERRTFLHHRGHDARNVRAGYAGTARPSATCL
jgi:hypothetical protein